METTCPSPRDHTILLLPFTNDVCLSPTPLLPIIFEALTHSSLCSLTVLFSTPQNNSSSGPDTVTDQLYSKLRSNPRGHWDTFQSFLGRVYATLAAAQWGCGRVLMDVEVAFEGELLTASFLDRLRRAEQVIEVAGYEHLPLTPALHDMLPPTTAVLSCPPLSHDTFLPKHHSPGLTVVALGGTFDHLHAAHKLLLHLALFLSTRMLIVGIMSDSLLSSKSNAKLVEGLDCRISNVEDFLARRGARKRKRDGDDEPGDVTGVRMNVVEIFDPLGPTGTDPDIQALVVSRETLSGGAMVNRIRKERNLPELEMFAIEVIASSLEKAAEATEDEQISEHHQHSLENEGGNPNTVKTLDLSLVLDEKKLKDLKMGSTAIRQWIAERKDGGYQL